MGHATMENRHGLAVAGMVTHADGTAERRASEIMLKARSKAAGRRITVGEDKAYDTADHVANLRAIKVTPHVTQNNGLTKTGKIRKSAIDQRTTRHPGYGMSQSRRAMTECIFGWGKQHGTMRKTKHRGIARVAADFMLNLIAYTQKSPPNPYAARKTSQRESRKPRFPCFSANCQKPRHRPGLFYGAPRGFSSLIIVTPPCRVSVFRFRPR